MYIKQLPKYGLLLLLHALVSTQQSTHKLLRRRIIGAWSRPRTSSSSLESGSHLSLFQPVGGRFEVETAFGKPRVARREYRQLLWLDGKTDLWVCRRRVVSIFKTQQCWHHWLAWSFPCMGYLYLQSSCNLEQCLLDFQPCRRDRSMLVWNSVLFQLRVAGRTKMSPSCSTL